MGASLLDRHTFDSDSVTASSISEHNNCLTPSWLTTNQVRCALLPANASLLAARVHNTHNLIAVKEITVSASC
jgi:hypothetical protein